MNTGNNDFYAHLVLSPPFEGGVAGTIDYMKYTKIISRPGWLI